MRSPASRRSGHAGRLPAGPRAPFLLRVARAGFRLSMLPTMADRRAVYGSDFTLRFALFGKALVISEPDEVRALFKADPDRLGNMEPNLGRVMGPGSLFALSGEPHRAQRKLLTPAFHGNRLVEYRGLMAEEARAGMAAWPAGKAVASLPVFNAITLNIILRTVFGAEGNALARLRELLPAMVGLGSLLAFMPIPRWELFGFAPWGRLERMADEYRAIVHRLVGAARADPALEQRSDILALLVGARYDDGTPMSESEIAEELITLLTAGHETTANTLAWAVERLRRHPQFMARLIAALDEDSEDGEALLDAFINEVQRTRPVIPLTLRRVLVDDFTVGPWQPPRGMHIVIAIGLVHTDARLFPEPERFDPDRFVATRPDPYQLIPFGGGVRRCIGAAFAHMELQVVLRTLLAEHVLEPTTAPGEATRSRGVATAPAGGGQIVRRARTKPSA